MNNSVMMMITRGFFNEFINIFLTVLLLRSNQISESLLVSCGNCAVVEQHEAHCVM